MYLRRHILERNANEVINLLYSYMVAVHSRRDTPRHSETLRVECVSVYDVFYSRNISGFHSKPHQQQHLVLDQLGSPEKYLLCNTVSCPPLLFDL